MNFEHYLYTEQKKLIKTKEDIRKKADKIRNELNEIIRKGNGDIYEIFNFLKNRNFIVGSDVSKKIKELEETESLYKKENNRLQKINEILKLLDRKKSDEEKIEIFEKFCLNYEPKNNN